MLTQPLPNNNTPTLIVSGFLGSGKTTVITHLVEELQAAGQQVVYIKNEIGDEALDSKLMQGKNVQSRELLNGCICCTLVGPFQSAITEIVESYSPDLIIIEASGAADPAAIALMIDSHLLVERDSVVSVVDVVNFTGYKDLSVTARNQTTFTDLIIFNKIELADDQQKYAVVGYVRELNEHSPIIEAPNGRISASALLSANPTELNRLLKRHLQENSLDQQHDHISEDGIEAFSVPLDDQINQSELESRISQLPRNVIRVKGLVTTEIGQTICNAVAGRVNFSPAPETLGEEPNLLIIIGIHVKQDRESIIRSLQKSN